MFGPMRTTLALVLFCAACGGSTPPVKQVVSEQPDDATPVKEAPPPEDPPPPTREEQIAAALARVPAIRAKVSELRALPSTDVPASTQSLADFEAFVRKEVAEEIPVDEAKREARALAHLGVLAEEIDLIEISINAAVSQVAAYYDPDTKRFAVVQVPEDDQSFDMVSAHELTHAVQDQNFDLNAFMPLDLSDDAANARRFLVEGDATVMMLMYLVAGSGQDPNETVILQALRGQIDMMAGKTPAEMTAMMGGGADPAAVAAAALPPWIIAPMFDSYFKGARAVMAAKLAGDWAAVDALYKAPPSTTEQMLHPAQKLVCHREEPATVALTSAVAGKGWAPVMDGVLGELGLRIYGEVWGLADREQFAAGWNGDRWAVVEKDGAMRGFLATAWDTADDAKEFAAGMLASFQTRKVDGDVVVTGDRVDVVVGCTVKTCKASMAAMAKLHKKPKKAAARKVSQKETDCLTALL